MCGRWRVGLVKAGARRCTTNSYEVGGGVASARLATGAVPLLYQDLRVPAAFAPWPYSPAPGAAMFAPLSWNGCYFGCIYCCSVRPHTYTADDVSVLGGFADLASLVWIARAGPR